MNIKRLSLWQTHVEDILSQKENTCLLTDETSKLGTKFMGYHMADKEGNIWVLGLHEMVSKSGKDTLSTFKDILADIDVRCKATNNEFSSNILKHISATMSDRASTELKFSELLQQYRESVIPLVASNYNRLEGEDQEVINKLHNFFCGLHALVHLADVANQSIKEAETALFDDEPPISDRGFKSQKESSTTRLVRTACKAFARGGCEKSGCHGYFLDFVKPFLEENGLRSLPIEPHRGNRFNILFSNAAGIYFLRKHMMQFLSGHQNNGLLIFVLSFLVTTPLWVLLEDQNTHILSMNDRYVQLTDFFNKSSQNIQKFIDAELVPFPDMQIDKDKVIT